MNEIQELFQDDEKVKKKIAISSKHKNIKINHNKKFYSKKELNKMNGEMQICNLKAPMTWKAFCKLSYDLQDMYLSGLQDTYNVTVSKIAEMFNKSSGCVRNHILSKNLSSFKFQGKGHKMSKEDEVEWDKFLNQYRPLTIDDKEKIDQEFQSQVSQDESNLPVNTTPAKINRLNIGYDGEINLDDVIAYIQLVLGDKFTGHLDISFTR